MKLNEWKESGRFCQLNDHEVFYHQSAASDEVLLCLHGFPASSFDYRKIWAKLTERFAVVAFDMIGYGFSAKPSDFGYTTFDQVDVLQKLLEKLKIKRVHILAHDYGNTITQELLARQTENRLDFSIESIVMLNGALFPETHRPILAQKILIGPLGPLFSRMIPDTIFKRSLASVFGPDTRPSEAELSDFARLFNHNRGKRIAHRLIRYMTERTTYRERWVGALGEIRVPFRMINGLADPVSGRHLVARFREVVPQLEDIVEIENIGHFPHLEVPEEVIGKIFEFYNQN